MYQKDEKPTASAPEASYRRPSAKLLGIMAIGIVLLFLIRSDESCTQLGDKCYQLETVRDSQSRQQGLSGREYLAQNAGMLFVFDEPANYCMWMKDMKFPLDFIWLDDSSIVIDAEKSISPHSFPNSFCPNSEAGYVIELNSGEIDRANIKIGDKIMIN
jgi:uncharacterized membrane protein (UPF0127 family)